MRYALKLLGFLTVGSVLFFLGTVFQGFPPPFVAVSAIAFLALILRWIHKP